MINQLVLSDNYILMLISQLRDSLLNFGII